MHLRTFYLPFIISLLPNGCLNFSSEELFYQLGVRQFGDFSRIKLEPPPSLRSLLEIAVEADETTVKSQLSKTEIVDVRRLCFFFFLAEVILSFNSA
jgi:hypothetical protein